MKSQTWIATLGPVRFDAGELQYVPSVVPPGPPTPTQGPTTGVAKSNIFFEDGEISFEVLLQNQHSICQLILNADTPNWLLVGFNTSGAPYGIQTFRNNGFELLSTAGTTPDFSLGTWIPARVNVSGSTLNLSVRDVPLCTANIEVSRSALAFLFQGPDPIKVRSIHASEASPKAFVVMQFAPHFNELYQDVIKPSCETFGYEVVRADDIYTNGQIVIDIVDSIKSASVVIADVTPDNPNVYYEVGYAHALAKPTILLCDRRRERLPFDVSGFRTVFYENTIGGKSAVEERLRKHLEAIRRPTPGLRIPGRLTQR